MAEPGDVFKAYDVRGTVPDQLDADLCRAIGAATARFCQAERLLVVRDMRPSGVELSRAFAEGARRVGTRVTDLGMASTDFLYFAAGVLDAPGAMFTASHNPASYNGIKLCQAGARPIGSDTGLGDIQRMTMEYLGDPPASGDEAPIDTADLLGQYADHVRSFVDVGSLAPLRVVADTANGMGGLVVPLVFEKLPFQLTVLFGELDGTFPNHPADPIQEENLADLKRAVIETGADVGLAFDGDADRVFLVDEQANPVSGSLTTALVASSMLDKQPGATVLYNLICSKVVREVIEERGGRGVRTRVGHSFIKETMAQTGAVFGGEHSGHYYFADNYRADSGIIAAMIVLELLSSANEPLSRLLEPFRRYVDSGEINTKVKSPETVMKTMAERVGPDASVDTLDGLTVDYGDWWYNVRPSNTEPLLRLNVEAPDQDSCTQHTEELVSLVRELGG
ncbi:MAG: phosphomannomutase/phosphoglucomutase [Acidimicrobiales bacterium]